MIIDQLQPLRIIEIEVNIADIDMVDRFKLHINELDLVILLIDFSDIELLSEPSETRMLHQIVDGDMGNMDIETRYMEIETY